jgi:pimeloyl-ACP methyl ester carboxylesterase
VTHLGHRIHVDERAGADPPVVLLHGFPDNRHLYDRLVPHLVPRRVLAVDFLGWGASDKPAGHPRTAHDQTAEVAAVVDALSPDGPVALVAHDASGPPAIDYALLHPARVAALVLLNPYYAASRTLRAPEAIRLYSTPGVRRVARAGARLAPAVDRRLFHWQVGRFVVDAQARAELVPALYRDFVAARPAFWRLNADLLATLRERRRRVPDLARLPVPVSVVFGSRDAYLNPRVARELAGWFGVAPVLVPDAGHYVQVDAPSVVAQHVLAAGS